VQLKKLLTLGAWYGGLSNRMYTTS